jgi:hypothetical protein
MTGINVYANYPPPGAQTINQKHTMKRKTELKEKENRQDKSNNRSNILLRQTIKLADPTRKTL